MSISIGWFCGDGADRRNSCYRRHLLTELGEIELAVPRTRRFATGPAQGVATGREIEAPPAALAPLLI